MEILEQKVRMLESRLRSTPSSTMGEVSRSRALMSREIENISHMARSYYFQRPGGKDGAGSYRGFTLPPLTTPQNIATYSVSPSDTDIVIEGQALLVTGKISARMNRAARLVDWAYTGDFRIPRPTFTDEFVRLSEIMSSDIRNIIADAKLFKNRSLDRGDGSYRGYAIPQGQASTNAGWYTTTADNSKLVIEGRSKKYNFIRVVVIDSIGNVQRSDSLGYSGAMKQSMSSRKTASDSARDLIANDFVGIAARAYQYKLLPVASGGGGGKFTDYLSAQTTSLDGQARYEFTIDPDVILLKAVSTRGLGVMSVRIDSNGKLSGWYYTGKLSE